MTKKNLAASLAAFNAIWYSSRCFLFGPPCMTTLYDYKHSYSDAQHVQSAGDFGRPPTSFDIYFVNSCCRRWRRTILKWRRRRRQRRQREINERICHVLVFPAEHQPLLDVRHIISNRPRTRSAAVDAASTARRSFATHWRQRAHGSQPRLARLPTDPRLRPPHAALAYSCVWKIKVHRGCQLCPQRTSTPARGHVALLNSAWADFQRIETRFPRITARI